MTKRFGFTLAEVLITLGIIGVVAAMTIPNLIANTNGAKFRSQFKKSVSTLSQAGLMGNAQYDFDYAGTTTPCNANVEQAAKEHPEGTMTFCSLLNGTLTGQTYLGQADTIKRNVNGQTVAYAIMNKDAGALNQLGLDLSSFYAYAMADGSIIAFHKQSAGCNLPLGAQLNYSILSSEAAEAVDPTTGAVTPRGLKTCMGFIDVNGTTLPNKEVTCSNVTAGGTGAEANKASANPDKPCTVKNDATHMTDIFPVVFHDATVEPASDAAKYVLTSSK